MHTSFSRLRHLDLTPDGLIDETIARLGPSGTVVFPSFSWHLDPTARPWKGYADYFATRPPFDVRHTPANIGLLPELFRRRAGVLRSEHYWWSVAASGPLAETITTNQCDVEYPYGPDSAFGRMRMLGVKLLGLGVTLNTTSLAPVVDHELGEDHPQQILTPKVCEGLVIDHRGRRRQTRSYWLLPAVVRNIKPSVVIEQSSALNGAVRRRDYAETIQFSYPFSAYFEQALGVGRQAAATGRRVPWLVQYDGMRPATQQGAMKGSPAAPQ